MAGAQELKPVKSFREQMAENRKSERAWAAATQGIFGKDRAGPSEPAARLPRKKSEVQLPHRTEADVLEDIKRMAKDHPKVAVIKRANQGKRIDIGKNGKKRFTTFNTVQKANRTFTDSRDIRISDIELVLVGGKTFSVEAKEPGWVEPNWQRLVEREAGFIGEEDARLLAQRRYLNMMIAAGNYGMFCSDVLDLVDALDGVA